MKLQVWREAEGLTRKELSERLKCAGSDVTIRMWETGLRYPRTGALQEISALTAGAVTPNDFLAEAA